MIDEFAEPDKTKVHSWSIYNEEPDLIKSGKYMFSYIGHYKNPAYIGAIYDR